MALPLTWVEAPARLPRPNTSLDVIPVRDVSADHFVGFQYMADPCVMPTDLPESCYIQVGDPADTEKDFGDVPEAVTTDVFGVYAGIECFLNGGIEDFVDMSRRVLTNGEYYAVDQRLAAIIQAASSPTIPATAPDIVTMIGILETALANNVPGQGYIYLSPALATLAVANYVVFRNLDGTLETGLGTKIVVVTGPSLAVTGYASGQPTLWRSPINAASAPAWTTNRGRGLAERLYSLTIECGVWRTAYAPVVNNPPNEPPPGEDLVMLLGSIPSSPIPDGTDTTIIVQTNVTPTDEVNMFFSVNGGATNGPNEMTQTNPHEFVYNATGDYSGPGDSVEVWAVSEWEGVDVESNHITILVT